MLRFIVVADSHIRFPDDDVDTYPSNALMVDRNRRVVEMCNQLEPAFVVHLGDIVHPLPVEAAHEPAVQLAAGVYADLDAPIYYAPGNHDVGDKPNALVAVPAVEDENYEVFEQYWGPAFQSFDHDDCHFVVVDTPVLNSSLEREAAQRAWLAEDLGTARARGQRVFLFTHYPPFVRDAAEDEHYDNIGEPARRWLLELFAEHQVEAVFSGHVHNFFYNRAGQTDLYVVPSTGFVRPDYSELAAVAPESESGRDDPAKLGFFVVEITPEDHVIKPIRTFGSVTPGLPAPDLIRALAAPGWRSPVGVTLRHGWMSDRDFPTAGLDEFRRKTVRNDGLLPALWEARIDTVRIPVGDTSTPEARARIRHLHDRGMRFSVRSAGIPDTHTLERIAAVGSIIERWEIVAPPDSFPACLVTLRRVPEDLAVAIAPLVPLGGSEAGVHHFVTSGFNPMADEALDGLLKLAGSELITDLAFRIEAGTAIAPALQAAQSRAAKAGKAAVATVELPRGEESVVFDDDAAVADLVVEAVHAARELPEVAVFLDGFVDHDRSYYPRHGLIDRRFNPRQALHSLIAAASAGD
ncbi:MAG: metallophosphoesterase [Acidimicrobiia bacterium]